MSCDLDKCLYGKYEADLWRDIKQHWRELNKCKSYEENIKIPWFTSTEAMWKNVENKCGPDIFNIFPSSIQHNVSKIERELHWLLPKTDLVKAFLPVLLTSYFTNRAKSTDFLKLLMEEEYNDNDSVIEKGRNIWISPTLKETYKKLRSSDCTPENIRRTLPVYMRIMQFFVFLCCESSICNVGLSFYYFEHMTGYLHLLEHEVSANTILNLLRECEIQEPLEPKSQYDDVITMFSEFFINDMKHLSLKKAGSKNKSELFRIFLSRLKNELLESEGTLDITKIPEEQLQLLENIKYSKASLFSYFDEATIEEFEEMLER